MVAVRVVLGGAVGLALSGLTARAQPPSPDHTRELEVIESTERNEDPLGLDPSTGSGLDQAAAALPRAPALPPPAPVRGAAFSALGQVREESHAVEVKLEQGLAFVRQRMRFASRAKFASEIAYRLPLPEGAVPVKVAVCSAWAGCVAGAPVDGEAIADYAAWLAQIDEAREANEGHLGLGLSATPIVDAQGAALALRAAPLPPNAALELEVEYVAEAPVRGGRTHFTLQARGYDPNLAPSRIEVRAPGLTLLGPESLEWPPELPLTVRAELPHGAHLRPAPTRAPCGKGACTRSFEAMASEPADARPTWLWIDASPSMEGPARGRVDAVLAALLARLSPETPMQAFAFAARAEALGSFHAAEASLSTLSQATLRELGAATRVSSVVQATQRELAKVRPRVLILSDALFDADAREARALDAARRAGAELWLIDVGQGAARRAPAGVRHIEVPDAADLSLRGIDPEPLSDALGVVLSREPVPGLRTGEQRVREHKPNKLGAPAPGAPWLWFWLARDAGPRSFAVTHKRAGLSSAPIAAIPYESSPPAPVVAHTAMPAESVLDMLRTQLVPKARACLRADRRGRGDYAVALTFRATFAHREVSEARVDGDIAEPLRACLEGLLPSLRVPDFSGRVRVRYPIYTQREAPPPVIELTPDAAEQVRRALSTPAGKR